MSIKMNELLLNAEHNIEYLRSVLETCGHSEEAARLSAVDLDASTAQMVLDMVGNIYVQDKFINEVRTSVMLILAQVVKQYKKNLVAAA